MADVGLSSDCIVVGGGLVGASIAYGLARSGASVIVLDEDDKALRATRGNFGLIWVQNKGISMPRYSAWSRDAARLWPGFASQLLSETGVDVNLQQPGGFCLCLSEAELLEREQSLLAIQKAVSGDYPFEMLDQQALRQRLPAIGPEVVGASFTPMDGHVNPLKLYLALLQACRQMGVRICHAAHAGKIEASDDKGFRLSCGPVNYRAGKIVLAAGLGNRALAEQVGLYAPVVPTRGQVLVTERLRKFLDYPTNKLRQTDEGAVHIGDSVEDVGFDDRTTTDVLQFMARRAVKSFPLLRDVNLVRAWGALRVMTPDGFPLYEQSMAHPGAYVVTCHSGVTLAAAHALRVAPWIAGGSVPAEISEFTSARFSRGLARPMYVT